MVQRIGTVDPATPHPDPSGGQAPRLAWSSTALHSPLPPLWIAVAYLGTGRAIAGKTKWGRRVDVGGGIAVGVLSRNVSAWIPAFAGNDEWRGSLAHSKAV